MEHGKSGTMEHGIYGTTEYETVEDGAWTPWFCLFVSSFWYLELHAGLFEDVDGANMGQWKEYGPVGYGDGGI